MRSFEPVRQRGAGACGTVDCCHERESQTHPWEAPPGGTHRPFDRGARQPQLTTERAQTGPADASPAFACSGLLMTRWGFTSQPPRKAAVRCVTEAVVRRVTAASRGSACGSSGRCSRPPSAGRQLSPWQRHSEAGAAARAEAVVARAGPACLDVGERASRAQEAYPPMVVPMQTRERCPKRPAALVRGRGSDLLDAGQPLVANGRPALRGPPLGVRGSYLPKQLGGSCRAQRCAFREGRGRIGCKIEIPVLCRASGWRAGRPRQAS